MACSDINTARRYFKRPVRIRDLFFQKNERF